jgi:hypothetical protein
MVATIKQLRKQREDAEDRVNDLNGRYLRATGWSYSSDTPDCTWLWMKEIKGVRYAMPEELALSMEDYIQGRAGN